MLQLLLQSGQTYDDIGSLLGSDVEQVRARARSALTEMGGEDPDGDVSLTDYLLGQADPIGRADAARHLQSDPDANALAQKLATQLRLIAPGADLPSIPEAKGKRTAREAGKPASTPAAAAPAAGPSKTSSFGGEAASGAARGAPSAGLSGRQKRLIAGLAAGAVVVLAVVLIATGAFSGGGGDNGDKSTATTGDTTSPSGGQNAASAAANPKIVRAVLTAAPGSDSKARGVAFFGQLKGQAVLQVVVKGLEPTAADENYSVWLYRSDSAAFRLSGVRVGKTGGIAAQLPVPSQVIKFISNGTFPDIDISLTKNAVLKAEAKKDQKQKKLTLHHLGDSVLRGPIEGPGVTTGASTGTGATGATGPTG